MQIFRRTFLSGIILALFFLLCSQTLPASKPRILQVKEQKIQVNGKEASIYALVQPDGTYGLTLNKGDFFNVIVENHLGVPTSAHWHGLLLPNNQDGVAFITQFPIYPGQNYSYQFPILQSGTYWIHAHYGLQAQKLYTAPLILKDPQEKPIADQEVVLLLNDFTFTSAEKILETLHCKSAMKMGRDLVDVNYDAFLVNFHTIQDPEMTLVKAGTRIRLRIINAASSTNFLLSLGELEAEAIAVDGNPIKSLKGNQFELAMAQRIDILVTIPQQGGAFPILAAGEGTSLQGGALLYTTGAPLPALSSIRTSSVPPFSYTQEKNFSALNPLSQKTPTRSLDLVLEGRMTGYIWTLNNQAWPEVTPLVVKKGERVAITFKNTSSMSHPMHLHGHVFQVTAINGIPLQGALRDTVLVMPNSTLTIQFDANYPGVWAFHCHNLYHHSAGMFTLLRYDPE